MNVTQQDLMVALLAYFLTKRPVAALLAPLALRFLSRPGLPGEGLGVGGAPRMGRPKTEEERRQEHYRRYGTWEVPPRGTGIRRRYGIWV